MLFHRDADGICAVAMVLKFYSGLELVPRKGPVMDDKFVKELIGKKPEYIVFLDLPVDQEWKRLKQMKKDLKDTEIIVMDHHIVEKDLNKLGMLHFNQKMGGKFKNMYIPASCLVFHSRMDRGHDIEDLIWIAVIGIIGDYNYKDCMSTLKKCEELHPDSLDINNVFGSRLSRLTDMISSLMTTKGLKGAQECLKLLKNADHYEELMGNKKLIKAYNIVEKEIRDIMNDFKRNGEHFPKKKLVIYHIKSKLNITSIIATKISEKHPDSVVIIRKESRIGWKVSMRNQSGKTNVGGLAKKATEGNGSGGGHFKSAGALAKDWNLFRKRILSNL